MAVSGAARLFRVDADDFGKCFDEFVGLLKNLPGLGDADAWIGGGKHV